MYFRVLRRLSVFQVFSGGQKPALRASLGVPPLRAPGQGHHGAAPVLAVVPGVRDERPVAVRGGDTAGPGPRW